MPYRDKDFGPHGGIKILPEPMLTYIIKVQWHSSESNFSSDTLSHQALKVAWKLPIYDSIEIIHCPMS